MRHLKLRRANDEFLSQPRVHRQSVMRWIYLAIVAGLAMWLINLFFGSFFYLSSEGMVLGEASVVAAEFPVTVREMLVREGDRITAGQVVAIVSSQSVAESLARFASDQADRDLRLSDLRVRSQSVATVIDLAQARSDIAVDVRRQLDSLTNQGWLPLDRRVSAVDSAFRSSEDLALLKAEQQALPGQIGALTVAFAQADGAIADLRALYGDGKLLAPIDGIVGSRPVGKGAVLGAGDPLMNIVGNDRFILAYVPTGGVFRIAPGQRVRISTGLQSFLGTIIRVEPLAVDLPREFQRAFAPVDRRQMIRVGFDQNESTPPLFSKVQLSSADWLPAWIAALRPDFLGGGKTIGHLE
jgi:multidrug resistance efflux pump